MDSVISKRIRKRYSYPWFPWGSVSVFPLDTKLWGYSSHWLIQNGVVVFIYNIYASPSGLQIILQLLILSNIMQILYTYFTVFIKFILIFSVMFLCCYKSTHKCVCVWCFRGHTHVIVHMWGSEDNLEWQFSRFTLFGTRSFCCTWLRLLACAGGCSPVLLL